MITCGYVRSNSHCSACALSNSPQLVSLSPTYTVETMSDFEEHNPFQTDVDDPQSDADSPNNSNVDLSSEPDTPPAHPARIPASPPVSAGINRGFSSPPGSAGRQAAFKPPPPAFKSDYCCPRDRWLHSGEDVEIQVRYLLALSLVI